jgi:hypothetical protein
MKITISPMAAFVIATLTGCAAAVPPVDFYGASSEALRRFQLITIVTDTDESEETLKDLGSAEGIYCKKYHDQPDIEDDLAMAEALDQIKLKAAAMGADFIGEPHCKYRDSGDFTNNCFSTLVCKARTLKLQL